MSVSTTFVPAPSFAEAAAYWHRLGWLSFGGPAGQIAMMHADLVDRRRWVDATSFAHGLNYCMLLPGPEAMQLACYLGWRLHGLAGGLVAGTLFVLPGALLLALLSWVYFSFGHVPAVDGILLGLKSAVLGILALALLRLGSRVLRRRFAQGLAVLALLALGLAALPFPLVVLGAALAGWAAGRWRPEWLISSVSGDSPQDAPPAGTRQCLTRSLSIAVLLALAWILPLIGVALCLGPESLAARMGLFFSVTALITFGGAYAVLPFVAQQAVSAHGWLSAGQMLAGLGLAETTPGPLVIVLEFVGFAGGWQDPDLGSPLAGALICAAVAVWATFLPSFLFVLPMAPWIERLRAWPQASNALSGITAAVVGVMANLGLWFGWHLWQASDGATRLVIVCIAATCFGFLKQGRLPLPLVVLAAGAVGWLAQVVDIV